MTTATAVTEVGPGLWSIPVSIPLPGLRLVFAYALELQDGLLLVDAGWSSEQSLDSLEEGLGRLGASLADVRGAVFTHAHGDHYGLAGALRERSGAWIGLHEGDVPLVAGRLGGGGAALADWLLRAGVRDADERDSMQPGTGRFAWDFPIVSPDVVLRDGDRVDVAGDDLVVLHTPGHTPGHVCFVDAERRVVLTGDHVLARITPNISASPYADDPLGDYLRSLDAVAALGDMVGLAGHEEPVESVADRAGEIRWHHDEQLRATLGIVESGAETVHEVAERMPWSRPWDVLPPHERRAALGEAQAHLVVLERTARIRRVADRPLRWRAGRVNGTP